MKSFKQFLQEDYDELQAAFSKAANAVLNYGDIGTDWYGEKELADELFSNERMDPYMPGSTTEKYLTIDQYEELLAMYHSKDSRLLKWIRNIM